MSPDEYTKIRTYFKNILPDDLDDEIINATDVALIASWIDNKKGTPYHFKDLPLKFNLIYRASRDCFRIEIIGGYNPLEWCRTKMVADERSRNHKNYQCKTLNSFLFSLISRFNPIISRVNFEKEAIIWRDHILVYKICISNHQDLLLIILLVKSKQHPYEKKIINRETFKIEEYEVFQVIIDNRLSTLILIRFQKIFKKSFNIIKRSRGTCIIGGNLGRMLNEDEGNSESVDGDSQKSVMRTSVEV
ncbi:hypothetical protein RhiirB3_451859 [Rhizophagus irregularis]|nr:hypothetical protein RhiirB3_451859 [Rhizophagus irregularis]